MAPYITPMRRAGYLVLPVKGPRARMPCRHREWVHADQSNTEGVLHTVHRKQPRNLDRRLVGDNRWTPVKPWSRSSTSRRTSCREPATRHSPRWSREAAPPPADWGASAPSGQPARSHLPGSMDRARIKEHRQWRRLRGEPEMLPDQERQSGGWRPIWCGLRSVPVRPPLVPGRAGRLRTQRYHARWPRHRNRRTT